MFLKDIQGKISVKRIYIYAGEGKISTTFQHKLNRKFVNSAIILKYNHKKANGQYLRIFEIYSK